MVMVVSLEYRNDVYNYLHFLSSIALRSLTICAAITTMVSYRHTVKALCHVRGKQGAAPGYAKANYKWYKILVRSFHEYISQPHTICMQITKS